MVSSTLKVSPSGPREKSSVQPTRSNASVPLGASTTPSTEMYSVTTILPMGRSPFGRLARSSRFLSRSANYDRRRGARSSVELDSCSRRPAAGERLADPQPEALDQLGNALELEVMAIARAEGGQLVRVRIDRAAQVRELPEEVLEAGRRDDLEDPARFVSRVPEGVPLVARLEHEVTRAGLDHLVPQERAHASLEDEAVLVLARMQVQRRGERPRRHRMLHEREALARLGPVDQEAHPDGAQEPFRAFRRTDDLQACRCRLHLSFSFRFTDMSIYSTRSLYFSYSTVKRNAGPPDIRAQAASRTPGRDAAADRCCGGRAPHHARSFPNDGARDRRAGGGDAADCVRALSRRPVALRGVLRPCTRDGTAAGSGRVARHCRSG